MQYLAAGPIFLRVSAMNKLVEMKRRTACLGMMLHAGNFGTVFRYALHSHVFYLLFGIANILILR
jgi:hypothetical protein